jgi:hypothetical protein
LLPGSTRHSPARACRAYDAAALEAWGLAAQVNLTLPGVLAAQPAGGQAGDAAMPLAGPMAGACARLCRRLDLIIRQVIGRGALC